MSIQTEEEISRIIGGVRSKSCHWPSAPLLTLRGGICTGSLVHPQIVVTAGHCNNGIRSVAFTDSNRTSTPKKYGVEYCRSHPKWKGEGASLGKHVDFTFCKLKKPVTDVQITPIMMGCELEYVKANAEIYAVGFGKTVGNNPRTAGTKFEVKTIFNRFSSENNGEAVIGRERQGSCHGDSGGPLYAKLPESKYGKDAGWRVFGVTSWGDNSCPGPANYGMLHTFVPFIEKSSGIDITPCTDAEGNWEPTEACKGAPLDPFAASGTWDKGCVAGPVGGYIASCGKPFADPKDADSTAPTVKLSAPKDDGSFEVGEDIEVRVEAKDDVGVTEVELLVDGKEVGAVKKGPFKWTLEDLKAGEHTLVAVAKDEAGNEGKSDEIKIEVTESEPDDTSSDGKDSSGEDPKGKDSKGEEPDSGEDGSEDDETKSSDSADSDDSESDGSDSDEPDDESEGGEDEQTPDETANAKGSGKGGKMSGGGCVIGESQPAGAGLVLLGLFGLVRRRR